MLSRLVIGVLCLSIASIAMNAHAQAQPVIKDPVEFNAYMKAVQMPTGIEKAHVLDAFLSQYPNSVMKMDVLELELFNYTWVKNEDEIVRTAERILEIEPENLRILSLLAYLYSDCATRHGTNAESCARSAVKYGRKGLDVIQNVPTPPAGMTLDEFNELKTQTRPSFQTAVSFDKTHAASPR